MRQKELLILSVVVFLTIIAWVVFEIHQEGNKSALEETFSQPPTLTSTIKEEVFEILQNKTP